MSCFSLHELTLEQLGCWKNLCLRVVYGQKFLELFQSLQTLILPTNTHPRSQIRTAFLGRWTVYRNPGSLHIAQNCLPTIVPEFGVLTRRQSLSSVPLPHLLSLPLTCHPSALHPCALLRQPHSLPVLLSSPRLRKENAADSFTLECK